MYTSQQDVLYGLRLRVRQLVHINFSGTLSKSNELAMLVKTDTYGNETYSRISFKDASSGMAAMVMVGACYTRSLGVVD